MDALGKSIEARMKLQSARVTATLQPGVALTLTSTADVTVPVTGLAVSGAESYGGQQIARVALKAGVPVTVSLVGTPVVKTPVVTVAATVTDPAAEPPALTKQEAKDERKQEKQDAKDAKQASR
jgi:hypothetical protein